MKSTLHTIIAACILLSLLSCDNHQKRETKYPDGKPKEEFQVVEKDGSFIKDGEYKTWYQGGQQEMSGQYTSGKKTGNWKQWFDNGQMAADVNYKDDSLSGSFVKWFKGGQKWIEAEKSKENFVGRVAVWYENGKTNSVENYDASARKDGLFEYWFEDGQKAQEINFVHGHRQGKFTSWFPNGKTKAVTTYVDDKLEGDYVEYFETGKVNTKGLYKNGNKDGSWLLYNQNGEVFIEERYDNGKNVTLVGSWKVNGDWVVNYDKEGTVEIIERGKKTRKDYSFHYPYIKIGDGDFLIKKISNSQYEIASVLMTRRTYNAVRIN